MTKLCGDLAAGFFNPPPAAPVEQAPVTVADPGTGCSTRPACDFSYPGIVPRVFLVVRASAATCISGGGDTGGEKAGELKVDAPGGGEATKLGVVLPEPKNMSLEGVPLADTEETVAAGL